jgi:phospholipid/cholesterol/gamma-HCH transport system substrate-binding protein
MVALNIVLQRVRNTPGLLRDVVIFAVILAGGVTAGSYIFSHYGVKAPWTSSFSFSADFIKAPAVQTQARQEVRIAGVPVGRITSAEPVSDGVRIGFNIDQDQKVYKDARLVIRSKTPLNILYVALNPGTPAAGLLPDGGTIPTSQTDEFTQAAEILNNLDARSQSAIGDLVTEADVALTNAPTQLPAGLRQLDITTQTLQPVIDALAQRRQHLSKLVTSISEISTAAGGDDTRLASLMASLETTLGVVASRDKSLDASLAQLPGGTSTLRGSPPSSTRYWTRRPGRRPSCRTWLNA